MYRFQSDGKEHWVDTAERPDRTLPKQLMCAEAEVIRSLVEGNTHEQIAVLRSASPRTVANQLASAFRKMGVSGRAALLSKLIRKVASVTPIARGEATLPVTRTTAEVEMSDTSLLRKPSELRPLPKATSGPTLSR